MEQYRTRREGWQRRAAELAAHSRAISTWRGVTALVTLILAYLAWGRGWFAPAWSGLPAALFLFLVTRHAAVGKQQGLTARAIAYYDRLLARVEGRWTDSPGGEGYLPPDHIYAADLDVFGSGSLFAMLAGSRTALGEETLASWLLAPAEAGEIAARQHAVSELRDRIELREDLALLGPDVNSQVHIRSLTEWVNRPPVSFPSFLRWSLPLLAVVAMAAFAGFFAGLLSPLALLVIVIFNVGVSFSLRHRTAVVLDGAENLDRNLRVLAHLLSRLERESFQTTKLSALRTEISDPSGSASVRLLARRLDWLDSGDHIILKALRYLLLWREQMALLVESWRNREGKHLAQWARAIGEFEALLALSALAYEHPDWCQPEVLQVEGVSAPLLEALDLRHPLLPGVLAVANDIRIAAPLQLVIISGSNMSGKSTFLRAIGLNTVLAQAGAPVSARSMRLSAVQTAASIRINDSLLDGRSRFMAEITRLQQIVAAAKEGLPVLFLLDELLSGTNSHDRRIGAASVLRKLAALGASGLVTTHDLALSALASDLPDGAGENMHFEDRLEGEAMIFDFKLKPGVVTHSNALALMRAVGLEV